MIAVSIATQTPIPPFDERGLLPPGTYRATLAELRASHLVAARTDRPWDHAWRAYLVDNLELLMRQLCAVGIGEVVVGGSFVEAKPHPGDIDGYFEAAADDVMCGRLACRLNELDPYASWTWDAEELREARGGAPGLPLRDNYAVELYPRVAERFGVVAPDGRELPFEEAFRVQRITFREKGVLLVRPE